MYCPKCRTEYKRNCNTCTSCNISLVEVLPDEGEFEPTENSFHPIRDQINNAIESIRNNQKASWFFAISVGIIYKLFYGYFRDWIWTNRKVDFIERIFDLNSLYQLSTALIGLNVLTELSSAILPALICGLILVHVYQQKAFLFSRGAVVAFLILSSRLWLYWIDPNAPIHIKIIGPAMPILDVVILMSAVWIIQKVKVHIITGSTATRSKSGA